MNPLVSVVITSYNYAKYVCTAIDSVLNQDYDNLEVVVTDNCSTDDTLSVLERYASDPRVRINVNGKNVGITPNINVGIGLTRGDYVVILSADDWLLPGHLTRLVDVAERHPEVGFVYATAYLCRDDGGPYAIRHVLGQTFLDYIGGREEFGWLMAACYMCLPTILFRRQLFDRYGKFDESFAVASDWEITVRMIAAGVQVAYVAAPLVGVRIHETQASGREYVKSGDEFLEHMRIVERYYDGTFFRRHGREARILGTLRGRYDLVRNVAPDKLTAELDGRAQDVVSQLESDKRVRASRNPPSVAIIVTSSGRLISLGACLQSIAWQTYRNWKVWLLQDQGFEAKGWALQHVPAQRLQYFQTPERFGVPLLRNQALVLASADYLLFVDEDTQLAPRHLEELVLAAEGGEGVAMAGTVVQFNRCDNAMGWQPVGNSETAYLPAPSAHDLLVASCTPLSAVLFDCSVADELHEFDPAVGICADWDFLIRLSKLRQWSHTGSKTLVEHAFLGLNTQLLQQQWGAYLPCMDAIYQRYTVPDVDVLKARERHRSNVITCLQRGFAAYADVHALLSLYSVLSGSALSEVGEAAPA